MSTYRVDELDTATFGFEGARAAEAAMRVAGRYRLEARLGSGGFGEVWRAVDEATGAEVALKLLGRGAGLADERVCREIAAMRLLQHPGIVKLLDAGDYRGGAYISMEIAPGTPFPGRATPSDWATLAPAVIALLRALGGVHANGLVHRDLKPANVLVDGDRVTVLDFGMARGQPLGNTITRAHAIVGTPAYLAPEQVIGGDVDARADLWAVGAMIYEALSGATPFTVGSIEELLASRTRDAPPLAERAKGVPPDVASVIDRLLARDPAHRIPTATAAVLALGGVPRPRRLPWVGSRDVIDRVVTAARAGRSVDVGGAAGSGRTRVLDEVAEALVADGRVVHVVPGGKRGLESLRPVVGGLVPADAEAEVRRRLAAGEVFVADVAGGAIDRITCSLLDRVRDGGAVLRAVDAPGDLRPALLDAAGLAELFHGPEVVHHFPSDGAAALHARTAGHPGRVEAEVEAWLFAEVVRWDGERLRANRAPLERVALGLVPFHTVAATANLDEPLDDLLGWIHAAGAGASEALLVDATGMTAWELRAELEELCATGAARIGADGSVEAVLVPTALRRWTERERRRVHRCLAEALPPGARGRLALLATAGDLTGLADEALLVGTRLIDEGRPGTATSLLEVALGSLPASELDRARALARAALSDGNAGSLRRVAHTVLPHDPAAGALVEAWGLAQSGAARRATDVDLSPTDDEELEAYRILVPIRGLAARDPAAAEAAVAALDPPVGSALDRRRQTWLGLVAYHAGRFEQALAAHERALASDPSLLRSIASRVNAGLAAREALAYDRALPHFEEAASLAEANRISVLEAFARVGARTIEYRLGRLDAAGAPDLALIDAVELLGMPGVLAPILLNEAAVAWRTGRRERARDLAERAARTSEALGQGPAWAVGAALAAHLGAPAIDLRRVLATALGTPRAALEVGALLAGPLGVEAAAARDHAWSVLVGMDPHRRLVLLSPVEALAL